MPPLSSPHTRTFARALMRDSICPDSQDTYKPVEAATEKTFRKGRMDLFGTGYGMN